MTAGANGQVRGSRAHSMMITCATMHRHTGAFCFDHGRHCSKYGLVRQCPLQLSKEHVPAAKKRRSFYSVRCSSRKPKPGFMAQGRTHYEVLGVARDCTAETIKAAYQQLLLTTHPDKAGLQKQQEFHALQEAYQVREAAAATPPARLLLCHCRSEILPQSTKHSRLNTTTAYSWLSLHAHPIHSSPVCLQTLRERSSRALYDHQISQAELKATVVLHDEIDVDDMDLQERELPSDRQHGEFPNPVTYINNGGACTQAAQHQQHIYSYPCRCGDQYVLQGSDLQLSAGEIIIPCRCVSPQGGYIGTIPYKTTAGTQWIHTIAANCATTAGLIGAVVVLLRRQANSSCCPRILPSCRMYSVVKVLQGSTCTCMQSMVNHALCWVCMACAK